MQQLLRRMIDESISLIGCKREEVWLINADSGQIEQIIMNLVVNARDAMSDGGVITIETANVVLDDDYCALHPEARSGEHVMLAVSDTGCGMSAEVKEHLFEPFFTTKPRGKGTGLGLSVVFGVVKQHGGSIEVYSEEGRGTTVKTYFPRVKSEAPLQVATETPASYQRGHETIMVVEDEAIVRDMASSALSNLGYKVLTCADGPLAIAQASEYTGQIDLLLTDVVMPGMNGRVLADKLKLMRPTLKVIYCSGYTENIIAHHGVLESGIEFLGKPYTPKDLSEKVRCVLDKVAAKS
jgi:CheY-like chemotaxis protein